MVLSAETRFLADIDTEARRRSLPEIGDAIKQGPCIDEHTIYMKSLRGVVEELELLAGVNND